MYNLDNFPPCPYCSYTPTLHTDGESFVELVCACEGAACPVDLSAIWEAHVAESVESLRRSLLKSGAMNPERIEDWLGK